MIGVSPPPNYNNIEALNQQYYSQCLQEKIEKIELLLDEGFELPKPYGTEFEIDDLLRMDSATMMGTLEKGKNYLTPNEGRLRLNLRPVTGGDTVFRQQQDFSLEALNKRDSQADPFGASSPEPASPADDSERAFMADVKASLVPLMAKQATSNALLAASNES
jgi:phage portal protein BeeE